MKFHNQEKSVSTETAQMNGKIIWLRISYWTAAICDFLLALIVFFPGINGETHLSLTTLMMASAAFSWGVMMLFADKKPVERRWVLIPTILVAALLAIANMAAIFSGIASSFSPLARILPFIVNIAIWTFSYLNSANR